MHISQLKESKFLKKEDVGTGTLVTIQSVSQENVAKEGAPEELKWCLWTEEFEKPMVLNSTNGQIIAKIIGSEESEEWTGHQIELYNDPSVSFGGKLIGGIRVRVPGQPQRPQRPKPIQRPTSQKPPPGMPPGMPEDEEESPF